MNLTCLISSGVFSLSRSDTGWIVEIHGENLSTLCMCGFTVEKVIISKAAQSVLDFSQHSVDYCVIPNIFESLEHNNTVNELLLRMHLKGTLANTEQKSLEHAVTQMLKHNCALKHLALYGNVEVAILKGLEAGLETNP